MMNPAMIKQMQQKMEKMMAKMQKELSESEVIGESGQGMVKVTLDGHQELKGIKIDPEAVDLEEIDMLEDLIVAAFGDAFKKSKALSQTKMGSVAPGLSIPGLF